jgi:hypothetical protein
MAFLSFLASCGSFAKKAAFMLEYFWKKFTPGPEVGPEVESSPAVNVGGLEKKISVPEPTREDRRWAQRLRNASAGDIADALHKAIENGMNWRVWYLINRPARQVRNWLTLGLGGKKALGFDGEEQVGKGMAKAAEHDNVTAAYLLLKFAEKNPVTETAAAADTPCEACNFARRAILDAAARPGSDVFTLVAQSAVMTQGEPADGISLLKQAALRAAGEGRFGHIDAMVDNGLLSSRHCVEAFMESFSCDKLQDGKVFTPLARRELLSWMLGRGIVDDVFADEAAAMEVRVATQKAVNREAREQGWRESRRLLQGDDTAPAGPCVAEAEISVPGPSGAVVYAFNFAAQRAERIEGARVQLLTLDQVAEQPAGQTLLEQGRAFVESGRETAPELVWQKGEPFRLRFKGPQ